ncbi:MAG: urate oxidase [Acidobacteriia bacterium]|nr:urate oxidase [Terriglobia bacterium]
MQHFASGWKRNYYGKADVTVYRLQRDGAPPPVFAATVTMLLYGDAFWPTYTTGDNTGLIATDSMKNFIQRETLHFAGTELEPYCRFLAEKFLQTYPQTEGIAVEAVERPYAGIGDGRAAFAPAGPERAMARIEMRQGGEVVESRAGIHGFKLLRLGGSAFAGFVRDQYTTLPDIANRPLHMGLDVEWLPGGAAAASRVRPIVHEVFQGFESGSIQQVINQIGTKMLADLPPVTEVNLEADNRTWDTVVEQGEELGVYTEPRPPYGVLGLRLRR